MRIIVTIITLIIILLLTIKKNYKELLTSLIISLIIGWIFVSVFFAIPLTRTVAISIGEQILKVLIYATVETICMGIFYYVLQKHNYIISLIVYLVINLIINKFYITISENIVLDLFFNLIIGIIIIIVYRKSLRMEDINWFVIIGTTINAILTFFIVHFKIAYLFKTFGSIILIYIWMIIRIFGPLLMPYIIGIILSAIIIHLTRKKLIKKDEKFRTLVNAMIIGICACLSIIVGNAILNYLSAMPDELYTQMKGIDDNKSLIGKSKEEVVTALGEPHYKETNNENGDIYKYDAGKISNYFALEENDSFYIFKIFFDENDKVISTSIDIVRRQ